MLPIMSTRAPYPRDAYLTLRLPYELVERLEAEASRRNKRRQVGGWITRDDVARELLLDALAELSEARPEPLPMPAAPKPAPAERPDPAGWVAELSTAIARTDPPGLARQIDAERERFQEANGRFQDALAAAAALLGEQARECERLFFAFGRAEDKGPRPDDYEDAAVSRLVQGVQTFSDELETALAELVGDATRHASSVEGASGRLDDLVEAYGLKLGAHLAATREIPPRAAFAMEAAFDELRAARARVVEMHAALAESAEDVREEGMRAVDRARAEMDRHLGSLRADIRSAPAPGDDAQAWKAWRDRLVALASMTRGVFDVQVAAATARLERSAATLQAELNVLCATAGRARAALEALASATRALTRP